MRASRKWLLAGLTMAFMISGCGLSPEVAPTAIARRAVPYGLLAPAPSVTTTTVAGAPVSLVTLYFEGLDQHLVTVRRLLASPTSIAEALNALAAGPTEGESNRGLVSPASSVGPLVAGPVRKEVVAVYVPLSFESLGGQDQVMAAAQVVYTLTGFPGIRGVEFFVGGQRTQVPNDDGHVTAAPLTRIDYAGLR